MHLIEAKSLLTRWNGMNLYRGCTHGCEYCDSAALATASTMPDEVFAYTAEFPELQPRLF